MKFLFVGSRAAGRTRAAAQHHLAHVHGRMVVSPPAGAGAMPARYTQNHVIDGAYPAGAGAHATERDLVTELWFASMEDLRQAVATPYYRDHLAPDEPRFVDTATVQKLRVEPRALIDGAAARYKLFVFLGQRGTAIGDAPVAVVATMLGEEGFTRVVANRAASPPGTTPFADLVIEAWHADLSVVLARIARLDALLVPLASLVDPTRTVALAAQEYPAERLRAMHEAPGKPGPSEG